MEACVGDAGGCFGGWPAEEEFASEVEPVGGWPRKASEGTAAKGGCPVRAQCRWLRVGCGGVRRGLGGGVGGEGTEALTDVRDQADGLLVRGG